MTTPSKFKWTERMEQAAVLVALDDLTNEAIARRVGVSRYCLDKWKRRPQPSSAWGAHVRGGRRASTAKGRLARSRAASAHQRQVHLVDDFDENAVRHGGGPARDVFVAQQHDGHGGYPWMKGFGQCLSSGHGTP